MESLALDTQTAYGNAVGCLALRGGNGYPGGGREMEKVGRRVFKASLSFFFFLNSREIPATLFFGSGIQGGSDPLNP